METIVFASNNKHKIEEVKEILSSYKILSLKDIGFIEDIEENGKTFLENALIKARATVGYLKAQNKNFIVISDDSGLCVEALEGAPGVFSARYAGNHDPSANRAKLLQKLKKHKNRNAHFECVIVKMSIDGNYTYGVGKTQGIILEKETGDKSFGYDCIFYSNDLRKSFGEATSKEKNSVSHRGRAIQQCFNLSQNQNNK